MFVPLLAEDMEPHLNVVEMRREPQKQSSRYWIVGAETVEGLSRAQDGSGLALGSLAGKWTLFPEDRQRSLTPTAADVEHGLLGSNPSRASLRAE